MLRAIGFIVLLVIPATRRPDDDRSKTTPLSTAIADFNTKAAQHEIGRDQPPLTQDEVLAAIMLAEKKQFPEASQHDFERFKAIASTKEIPADGEFEILDGLDPGGDFIFDVWYVRIRLNKEDGGNYAFTIRERRDPRPAGG